MDKHEVKIIEEICEKLQNDEFYENIDHPLTLMESTVVKLNDEQFRYAEKMSDTKVDIDMKFGYKDAGWRFEGGHLLNCGIVIYGDDKYITVYPDPNEQIKYAKQFILLFRNVDISIFDL